jgi:histone deacetylase complex subunit SAP18
LIFPDVKNAGPGTGGGRYISKDLGSIVIGDGGPGILPDEEESEIVAGGQVAGALGGEPGTTLQDARFQIGDYVSCAILPPLEDGGVAPPPGGPPARGFAGDRRGGLGGDFGGRGGFGGPRENGFGFRGRGGPRGGGNFVQGIVPAGEWRRGERVPEGPSGGGGGFRGGRGFGGGYGRGFGGGEGRGVRGGRW